jgi:RNA polymerase-binding transcription factor DksA
VENEAARERLEAEQARVQALVEGLRGDLGDEGDGSSEITDPADTGSDAFEREKDLAILDQLEAELAELQAALGRIDDGTYGVDEVTGEPIDPARLEVLPTARTNVDDQGQR